jgi:hypothetical protein
MPSINTKKSGYNNAKTWRDVLRNSTTLSCPVYYIGIGNHVPYANEADPTIVTDTISEEKRTWDNMFAAKRVTGNDVDFVIPRVNWTANTKYRNYDDTIEISNLVSTNTSQNLKPFYVITSARNVYKCLSNNSSANSTVEPTGDYTTSNGNIATADGYIWKYMYNIKPSSKFFNDEYMPVPSSTNDLDFNVNSTGVVEGELTTIIVTSSGTNYRQASNILVDSFTTGQTSLKLSNTSLTLDIFSIPTLSNLSNLSISGTGIAADTHIESVDEITGTLTLSTATTASGGNANNITVSTRVYIQGDGTGAEASAILSNTVSGVSAANANVSKITISTIGTGYSRANAFIFGSGSGANARVIIAPKFGHAFNPASELNANNVMLIVRVGELDSTEGGLISTDTSFRQISLLRDPYKYNQNTRVNIQTANTTISQSYNLGVVAGPSYTLNEYVYQGSAANNATAYGFVYAQTTNQVKITQVQGTFLPGLTLTGLNSGSVRTVTTVTNPEFEPYTGDVLYIENALKTERADGQAENIKLIISF